MIQEQFAKKAATILQRDGTVIGLAVGGSWLSHEIDEFSDLDLILVTKEKISGDKNKMLAYANSFGKLLTGFTGEHVGEPRVLICLYDDPLLHVDIKFVTLPEFSTRIETPIILHDTDQQLENAIKASEAKFPYPDNQWIEDRFWTWIHYALLKIGRREYVEAFDFFGDLRRMVLGPLLHISNGNLPRGVRKVESQLPREDLKALISTLPAYNKASMIIALENAIAVYQRLRQTVFTGEVVLHEAAEKKVIEYLHLIKK